MAQTGLIAQQLTALNPQSELDKPYRDTSMKEGRDYPIGGKIGDPMPARLSIAKLPGSAGVSPAPAPTPATINLDPATQTVQGRVTDIVKSGAPFIEEARTRAAQQMNTRGLLNSSMAVGEGERAAFAAALPIASQDASTALRVAEQNQAAQNQFGLQQLTGNQAIEQQQLRGDQAKELAQIEGAQKQLLQSNQSAAQFFSQISNSIGEIMKEPNIGVEQKQQLVQKQLELLRNGLAVIGGIANLDLTGLLTFPEPVPAATDTGTLRPQEEARYAEEFRRAVDGMPFKEKAKRENLERLANEIKARIIAGR